MILVLSPAKRLDYETPPVTEKFSEPRLLDQYNDILRSREWLAAERTRALEQGRIALAEALRLLDEEMSRRKCERPAHSETQARLEQVWDMIDAGEITDSSTVCALALLARRG